MSASAISFLFIIAAGLALFIAAIAHETQAFANETAVVAADRHPTDAAPDALEPLLKRIAEGGAAVAGDAPGREPIDGLVDIVGALESYAEAFDHPGWRGLQQQ